MNGLVLKTLSERVKAIVRFNSPVIAGANPWQHWQLRVADDGAAWLMFDCAGAEVNVLSQAALTELDKVVMALETDKPKALVLRSAKAASFCVGVDIKEFGPLDTLDAARDKLNAAHAVANRFAAL